MQKKEETPALTNRGLKKVQGMDCVADSKHINPHLETQGAGRKVVKLVYVAPWVSYKEKYFRHLDTFGGLWREQLQLEQKLEEVKKLIAVEEEGMDMCQQKILELNGGVMP